MHIKSFFTWFFSKAMASYVPSGTACSSRMKAIKIKRVGCLCPARLKTKTNNKRDREMLSSCLLPCKVPGAPLQSCWKAWEAIQDGLLVVMLRDLGQRLPSSYPGCKFIPEKTVHTMSCLVDNLNVTVVAHLAFACQRFVSRTDRVALEVMKPICCLLVMFPLRLCVGVKVLTGCFSAGKTGLVQTVS